jgi:hypothetical protein
MVSDHQHALDDNGRQHVQPVLFLRRVELDAAQAAV